jgi:hypothetical protein
MTHNGVKKVAAVEARDMVKQAGEIRLKKEEAARVLQERTERMQAKRFYEHELPKLIRKEAALEQTAIVLPIPDDSDFYCEELSRLAEMDGFQTNRLVEKHCLALQIGWYE